MPTILQPWHGDHSGKAARNMKIARENLYSSDKEATDGMWLGCFRSDCCRRIWSSASMSDSFSSSLTIKVQIQVTIK